MRRRREIFIELTSLLDVILIMLFLILGQARQQTAEALSETEADKERIEALEQEVEGWKRQVITQNLVLDHSQVLTISVDERGQISLERQDHPTASFAYDWDRDTYARNRLRSELHTLLDEAGEDTVFLVFQYDRSEIYRTEYDMISELLQEVRFDAGRKSIPLSILEMDTAPQP